ncbi:uncharacterized protein LOC108248877 [Kryptolebias marmoratus]|uniref:uncharacterized protein LOC108248877 n=1 Tax=Kryptolebias marmoratus TaxID=37003 RepID=UPI0007F8EA11|nr:uncharacterized protein LOC108248877 [Kryptolebias marmoratus]
MNLIENKTLYPHLRDEDAVVVENAVKLAIDSVLNVLYGVNSAKAREYQRMVADRDKEIQRLESRLTELEHELQVLRRHGCTCGLFASRSRIPGTRQAGEQGGFDPGSADSEMTAEPPEECEMMLSLGVFARPPSHVSSQSHESVLPSSPSRLGLDPTCTSRSSEVSGVTDAARILPPSPSSLVVKEEPCDIDTVLIQWEMSEERAADLAETSGSPSQDKPSRSGKQKPESSEGKQLGDQPQADPGGFHVSAGEQLKNRKKNIPMSQLPEEAQRLKRAAWRAASRRYYARKIARQRGNPQRSGPIVSVSNSQPNSFMDKRRKMLMSELPDSQMLQRDAWRRYYERKTAFHQTENIPYGHLMEDLNPSGATQGPNREGPHTNSGGILCS